MSTLVAVVLLLALVVYAVFGGADFGAGFWDLIAGGPERGARPRAAIERSIGPVWEANHVWLIFIFVVTWSAFSSAYASITLTMFVPLTLAALGIVLRGASFAFRKAVVVMKYRRVFGGAFALSSVLVPFCMGAIAGGIAAGRVPAGGQAGDPVHSWLNPVSLATGVLGVAAAAYLAAVYLVWDVRRAGESDLVAYFRRRAIAGGIVAAVAAGVGLVALRSQAPYVFAGLGSRALVPLILSVGCGIGALVLLFMGAARGARLLAVLAVAGLIVTWGFAQWPYLLPESLTVADAAAPHGTLVALCVAVGLLVLLVVPAFVLLASANESHPNGLANGSDQVGRNYVFHNSRAFLAISTEKNDTRFQKTLGLNDYYFGDAEFDYPMGNVQMVGKSSAPMYRGEKPLEAGLAPTFALRDVAEHAIDFWLSVEDLPEPGNRVTLDRDGNVVLSYTPNNGEPMDQLYSRVKKHLNRLGMHPHHLIPRSIYMKNDIPVAGCAHQAGTVRFGSDPETSVLDTDCKAHELDNLYVVDTSFFPSIGAVNPALTAMANALRVGDHLLERLN